VLAASAGQALAAPTLNALVSPGGKVSILDGETLIATIDPGYYLAGWQYKSLAGGKLAKDHPGELVVELAGGGTISLTVSTKAQGRSLHLTYRAVPSVPLEMESVHVSVNFPAADWIGAPFELGETAGTVPAQHDALHLATGSASRIRLGPAPSMDGLVATVQLPQPRQSMLQDNRRWGTTLELRIGELRSPAWTWKAGEVKEIAFTVTFNRSLKMEYDGPVILKASKTWIPLRGNLEILPGSALDFSNQGWTRSPAGGLGWLRASASHPGTFEFEKEPGRPVRFYGPNFCFTALFPTHEEADRLADRLQRLGYNTMRIHHYESMPWSDPPGIIDPKAPNSLTFHAEALDRLDYLFAALKQRGIYMTTDLYVNRAVKAAEIYDDGEGSVAYRFKNLVHISGRAYNNMEAFARRLLTHVNPYTRLAYQDDPALAWIALINEGNLPNNMNGLKQDPRDAKLWDAAFAKWKKETGLTGDWGSPICKRFLWETHRTTQRKLIAFLRKDLRVKALLTDLNGWTDQWGTQACRTDFDYVDNHFYWDHPSFLEKSWQLPTRGWSGGGSAIKEAGGFLSRTLTRLLDKPFTISEYNFTPPNPNRAEGGLLMGAYAALQDWGALWRFAYSHDRDTLFKPEHTEFFNNVADPLCQASEYAAIALFLRGDVSPAIHTLALTGTEEEYWNEAHRGLGGGIDRLSWCVRMGTNIGESKRDAQRIDLPLAKGLAKEAHDDAFKRLKAQRFLPRDNVTDPAQGIYQSDTGEILLHTVQGVLEIVTPHTVGVAGPAGTTRTLGPLTVALEQSWAALWISSLDGRPLETSRRMLLVHLTDLQNTGMRFRGRDMKILEDWGKLPYLVRAGSAQVRLAHGSPAALKVWRLSLSGKRLERVRTKGKGIGFTVTTATKPDATFYYEISAR